MFEIVVGVYTGEKACLDKWVNTSNKTTIQGSVRGSIDIVRPEVIVNTHLQTFYNYAFIPSFGCYYYIPEINDMRKDLSVISLVRDPMQTFSGGIRSSPAIAARASDNHVNADYPDNRYKTLQSHDTSVYDLGNLGLSHTIIFGFVK